MAEEDPRYRRVNAPGVITGRPRRAAFEAEQAGGAPSPPDGEESVPPPPPREEPSAFEAPPPGAASAPPPRTGGPVGGMPPGRSRRFGREAVAALVAGLAVAGIAVAALVDGSSPPETGGGREVVERRTPFADVGGPRGGSASALIRSAPGGAELELDAGLGGRPFLVAFARTAMAEPKVLLISQGGRATVRSFFSRRTLERYDALEVHRQSPGSPGGTEPVLRIALSDVRRVPGGRAGRR